MGSIHSRDNNFLDGQFDLIYIKIESNHPRIQAHRLQWDLRGDKEWFWSNTEKVVPGHSWGLAERFSRENKKKYAPIWQKFWQDS